METISAVGFVRKLKPEIRLAQAISEFSHCLSNEKDRVQFKSLLSESPPEADDVIRLTEEINRHGAQIHRSWRPYGTRLVAILHRIRQFALVGDMLVGGPRNMIASGVWAVVRLALEISIPFLSYFENVTTMMLRIGQCLHLHKDFVLLFPKCATLQGYMCEYSIILVNIFTRVLVNCHKSTITQMATPPSSSFDTVFKPLESELATWGHTIEKRTTVLLANATIERNSSMRDRFNKLQVTRSREAAQRQRQHRKHQLITTLCPDQDELDLTWRRERRKGTSQWLCKHSTYHEWLSSETSSVLWVTGNLGSGKTVTMASAVAELAMCAPYMQSNDPITLSYFFCQNSNPKTLRATTILGSLVAQTLNSPVIDESLSQYLQKMEMPVNLCARLEDYVEVLLEITSPDWRGIFVLDGLDECPQDEIEDVLDQLDYLASKRRVHLLCSSRPMSACFAIAEAILDITYTLPMASVDRSEDILSYIDTEISRWDSIRQLPASLKKLIQDKLLVRCQGLFLWLSLQIEDICPRYTQELRSDAEIVQILENLPKSLPEAFDRALSRITDRSMGSRIFKLVASADPAMTTDELRVAVNVKPGDKGWNPSTLVNSGRMLVSRYGGSLLDIDEEDLRVRFIHYSAHLHLIDAAVDPKAALFHFHELEAERALGATCVTFLSYSVFENRLSTAQKVSFAKLPMTTAESVVSSHLSRKVFTMLAKYKRPGHTKVDLERLSYELQSQKWVSREDVHLFLEYAQQHWLEATRDILFNIGHDVIGLWESLIHGLTCSVSLPWDLADVSQAASWAIRNDHGSLFLYYLHSGNEAWVQSAISAAVDIAESKQSDFQLEGPGIGLLVPLYLLHTSQPKVSTLEFFMCLAYQPFGPSFVDFDDFFSRKSTLEQLSARSSQAIADVLHVHQDGDEVGSQMALFLLSYVLNINAILDNGLTILHVAIYNRHENLAFDLISMGANIHGGDTIHKPTPLQLSLRYKLLQLSFHLIKSGVDLEANPDKDLTPLFLAINLPHPQLVAIFLSHGLYHKTQKCGPRLETAFELACRSCYECEPDEFPEEILALLIDRGADVNSPNEHGETPLMISASMEKAHLTEILIALEADVNFQNEYGIGPLHYAQGENIECLLLAGADANAKTRGNLTPLTIAVYQGNVTNVNTLLEYGANPNVHLTAACTERDAFLLNRHLAELAAEEKDFRHTKWGHVAESFIVTAWQPTPNLSMLEICLSRANYLKRNSMEDDAEVDKSSLADNYMVVARRLVESGANAFRLIGHPILMSNDFTWSTEWGRIQEFLRRGK